MFQGGYAVIRIDFVAVISTMLVFGACTHETTSDDSRVSYRSNAGSLNSTSPSHPGTIIRQGDQIQFSVWGYPEFTTAETIKGGGTITIPLLGDIQVEGSTKAQL